MLTEEPEKVKIFSVLYGKRDKRHVATKKKKSDKIKHTFVVCPPYTNRDMSRPKKIKK